MRLAVQYIVILTLIGLFSSCAEVGTISGGPVDEKAPKPIEEKISPPNGSTHFGSTEISIPFNEFIRLNDPTQTIRMVPPHAKVSATINNKTLRLTIDGDLEENSTYAIYLNNTVQDITEKNDTIIQYVFSTGDQIDSLTYECVVVDAWNATPEKKMIVALFDADSALVSFTETDSKGKAKLNYLKPGNYSLYAFEDENKDLEIQSHEALGFPNQEIIPLKESISDSVPIRLFSPLGKARISGVHPTFPGVITLKASADLRSARFEMNGTVISAENVQWHSTDSVSFFPLLGEEHPELIVSTNDFSDTILVRMLSEEKNSPISLKPERSKLSPWDTIRFICNDQILSVNQDSVRVYRKADSLAVPYSSSFSFNELDFNIEHRDTIGDLVFEFAKDAVKTKNGTCLALNKLIELPPSSKFGVLQVDLKFYNEPIILLVMQGNKIIARYPTVPDGDIFKVEGLNPGEYSFAVVHDTNQNRVWDVGNRTLRTQPEIIDRFTETIKVRANWEVEVSLVPKQPQ